jgi:hypothetical protein
MDFITVAWNQKTGVDRVLLGLAVADTNTGEYIMLLKSNDGVDWTTIESFNTDAWYGPPVYHGEPEAVAIGPDGSALMTVHVDDDTCWCKYYEVYASQDAGET